MACGENKNCLQVCPNITCKGQFCVECIHRYFHQSQKDSVVLARLLECPGKCGTLIPTMRWKDLVEPSVFAKYLDDIERITHFRCESCDMNHNLLKPYQLVQEIFDDRITLLNEFRITVPSFVNDILPIVFDYDVMICSDAYEYPLTDRSVENNTHFWMKSSYLFEVLNHIIDPIHRIQIVLHVLKLHPRFEVPCSLDEDFFMCWSCLSSDAHFGSKCVPQVIKADDIKPCPRCGIYLQKTEGCLSVTCPSCDFSMCWKCLREEYDGCDCGEEFSDSEDNDSRSQDVFEDKHGDENMWIS